MTREDKRMGESVNWEMSWKAWVRNKLLQALQLEPEAHRAEMLWKDCQYCGQQHWEWWAKWTEQGKEIERNREASQADSRIGCTEWFHRRGQRVKETIINCKGDDGAGGKEWKGRVSSEILYNLAVGVSNALCSWEMLGVYVKLLTTNFLT